MRKILKVLEYCEYGLYLVKMIIDDEITVRCVCESAIPDRLLDEWVKETFVSSETDWKQEGF